jgi:hypothetical protein
VAVDKDSLARCRKAQTQNSDGASDCGATMIGVATSSMVCFWSVSMAKSVDTSNVFAPVDVVLIAQSPPASQIEHYVKHF